jgi:UPF0716 protein FxsA
MPLLLFFLVCVVLPLAELYVIVQVAQAIGALGTFALLALGVVLGVALLRAQGRVAWRRFRTALSAGRVPAAEAVDGTLIVLGASLLIVPGFITDVFGLLLLAPPTRIAARRLLLGGVRTRVVMSVAGMGTGAASRRRARQDYDVDSTARDIDPRHLPG